MRLKVCALSICAISQISRANHANANSEDSLPQGAIQVIEKIISDEGEQSPLAAKWTRLAEINEECRVWEDLGKKIVPVVTENIQKNLVFTDVARKEAALALLQPIAVSLRVAHVEATEKYIEPNLPLLQNLSEEALVEVLETLDQKLKEQISPEHAEELGIQYFVFKRLESVVWRLLKEAN